MKPRSFALAAAFIAVISLGAPAARAGRFTAEAGCDTLSIEPLRILLKFYLYNIRDYGDLCAIRIEPTDFYGVPINPILDCTAPSPLVCATDSAAGTAVFSADPCVPNDSWITGLDSLDIVVGAPTGHFYASLVIPGGAIGKVDRLQFYCASGTPALRWSWGRLKTVYR